MTGPDTPCAACGQPLGDGFDDGHFDGDGDYHPHCCPRCAADRFELANGWPFRSEPVVVADQATIARGQAEGRLPCEGSS